MTRTISALFRLAAAEVPGRTWLLADDVTYTYGEALARVQRAASGLRAAGVGPGVRVLVVARNTADYLLTWFALMEVGAVQIPVNPASSAAELDGFVGQVEPAYVVDDANVGALFDTSDDGLGPAAVAETDVAVMIPTSGTTGRSKLVMQTHLAYVMAGEGFPYWMQLTADDRLMTSLPLFHINAPAYSTLGSIAARASLALLPEFSARSFIDSARRFGATEFNAIGAMLEILMRQPVRADDADNPIRLCYTGPSPTRERQLEIEERFGFEIVCGYAMSESPYGLIWAHGTRPYGTLGSVRQHPVLGHVNDARVVDGELHLRNPAIMRGYYRMPDETAAAVVDGWLHTGDLVEANPDGTYTFLGRKKEVIRRRGENLSPAEVEAVLELHADVAEAAVVGVPSDLSEEEVKAFLLPAAGHTIDVRALHAFAREHLSRFKVPRYYEAVSELPHTATGRLAKHQLSLERTPHEVDMDNPEYLHTWIGSAARDRITLAGRDLPSEVMGRLSLTDLAYLLVTRRQPTAGERRVLDAVLVALADHGFTPSALSTRLTYTGAPEALQGAIAAGLLGAGSVFLGPAGDTAEFLAGAIATGLSAHAAVDACIESGRRVPGLGHPVHKDEDPRTPRIYEIAEEEGVLGPHLKLLREVASAHEQRTGKRLPVNGAGAGGAALADVGLPPEIIRAFVLIARTAGLVGHLAEEMHHPVGMPLYLEVEGRST